jgi:hypothetical protein
MIPTGVCVPVNLAVPEAHQPEQGPPVVAVPRPQEVTVLGVPLEPVDVGADRLVGGRADDLEPVAA